MKMKNENSNIKCRTCTHIHVEEVSLGHNDHSEMEHCDYNRKMTSIGSYPQEFAEEFFDVENGRYYDCPLVTKEYKNGTLNFYKCPKCKILVASSQTIDVTCIKCREKLIKQ